MAERGGYRGYIASRPFFGERAPQHVQNLVVRDYAARKKLPFLLSATEYAMPGCHMILEQVLDDLPRLDGIIAYSLFLMPEDRARRAATWQRILSAGKTFHGALEGLTVATEKDVARIEDIWLVQAIMRGGQSAAIAASLAGAG